MISVTLYVARSVLLIPVIAIASLCALPIWFVRVMLSRRPHHLAELAARNAAAADRVRLRQLEQDRMAARRLRRQVL